MCPNLRAPIAGLLVIAMIASSCAKRVERTLVFPDNRQTLDQKSPYLKVHLKNGDLLVLSEWEVKEPERTVTGLGVRYDLDRRGDDDRFRSASLDSVALFETNVTEVSKSVVGLTIFSGISLAGTVVCITNPKACFGSCPTFYIDDGTEPVLMAEGFSASISPSLEATDVDALMRAKPADGRLDVAMVNEALETHVVRHVDLLAVPRTEHGRTVAAADGTFWRASHLLSPHTARGPEGDILPAVVKADGLERFSLSDSTDLAARETLAFTFAGKGDGGRGLLIGSRQTLLSTYLFYQTLAYMGTETGSWLAVLERQGAEARERFSGMAGILGGISVWVERDGEWERAGEIQEHGPLAIDYALVPLPDDLGDEVRVQLRMTRGKHRLDYVALAELAGAVEPVRLSPSSVRRNDGPDADARARLTDPEQTLVTLPGDRYTLVYEFPEVSQAAAVSGVSSPGWDLFLESRGYYLEWIRDAWIEEEAPSEVAEVLFSPRRALRRLATEFKTVEGEMEDIFWRSKYARP